MIDETTFRNCMGSFATGVTVVTARLYDGADYGITVNSFASLSLKPPMIVFCMDRGAYRHDDFLKTKKFVVNILSDQQQELSQLFASPSMVNWEEVLKHREERDNVPMLRATVAHVICQTQECFTVGDHTIITAAVTEGENDESRHPLAYFRGDYKYIK